ncbi:MAG: hypothetical protein E4H14_05365 [Candidatus Thorarchaeota archaeon]|nr:MAG: hypothetical protein E4H14_05365 [Candidatus Thorarchaeota archaeon]
MASVSTTLETITTTGVVSDVTNLIVEKLDEFQREKLSQWVKIIEEHAERAVRNLTPTQLKRRKIEVVAAAAIYDAFLEFEGKTGVKLSLRQIHEPLGRTLCIINTTWNRLFDNRGSLRGDQLDVVHVGKSESVSDAITNVMQAITKAIDGFTPLMNKWLDDIRIKAIELSQSVPDNIVKRYDTLTDAVIIIYAAIQHHHGKMQVQISQRDLSLLSGTSPALISKCWVDFFENRIE